ncbi:MAG: serine hydroxymethyltransferase [Patescibacteria group bacterium]
MFNHLKQSDQQVYDLIKNEINRQNNGLEMIASENIVSMAVLEALGSPLTNKYSEGYPQKRYYGGNEYIDQIEQLAIDRAKQLFGAEHANVQPHAGSPANLAAYFALLEHGDKILAMDLAAGGHLTHGHKVNFSGKFYNVSGYGVDPETERIDYNQIREIARREQPKLILAGASAYPRLIDFAAFFDIAKEVGAYLMVDMAHIAGLVAAKLHPDPVAFADVVTTTTHKTLRGPRGAIILNKKSDRLHDKYHPDSKKDLAQMIDSAVFPGLQGGPLEHVIAAKAVAFKEALEPEFIVYQKQVIANARSLAESLLAEGIELVSGGTDNHLILINLKNESVSGKQVETVLDSAGIYTNKNVIPFDRRPPTDPSGLRLGTPALTSRGMKEYEMKLIGQAIAKIIKNIDDAKIQKETKDTVRELVSKYPIYTELISGK